MATVAIETNESVSQETSPWADIIYDILITAGVRQMSYVPDAGHARLIELIRATPDITSNVLTTEEEGIAIAAGAWAGGQRSVLLMQSSGVGNCVNMLSLIASCRMPLLTVVTMRGGWAEFNHWQVQMGRATPQAFDNLGLRTIPVDKLEDHPAAMTGDATTPTYGEQNG